VPVPPANCLDFGSLERVMAKKGVIKGRNYDTWETAKFACDQQYLGDSTYHSISMKFELAKSLRRRRLAAGDGKTKGDEGTFGFNLKTGNCVRPEEGGDGDCGKDTGKRTKPADATPGDDTKPTDASGESFAYLAAILSIFAL